MTQALQSRDISLEELQIQFNLQVAADKAFFPEWQNSSLLLTDIEHQQLRRIQKNYLNLAIRKNFSEEMVKMVVLSPLLDLGGFYQAPFGIATEEPVEIMAEDRDLLIKGKIDVLVVRQQFWVLVIESKSTRFDVLTALPQALTYMLDNPQKEHPVYGLLVNGREFVFIRFVNINESNTAPIYARSRALSVEQDEDLEQVLKTLKIIHENIVES
ncbi:MAG: type I restriction endonuclease subunit R [Cyanothece sp. SIO2G6]|nr:type I restriction endonuclease subunit R [Cyanothece sp. SIO2G6]